MPNFISLATTAAGTRPDRGRQGKAPINERKTIVLADGDWQLRSSLSKVLRSAGYVVFAVSRPGTALDLVRNHAGPIDLLVTNFELPDGDGIELARTTRRESSCLAVLILSMGCTDENLVNCGFPVLYTPFSSAMLLNRVRKLLAGASDPIAA